MAINERKSGAKQEKSGDRQKSSGDKTRKSGDIKVVKIGLLVVVVSEPDPSTNGLVLKLSFISLT